MADHPERRPTMSVRLGNVTLDCDEPAKVAAFWSAALDRPVDEGGSDFFVSIGMNDDKQTGWFFLKVPEGKSVKNRMHVDLRTDNREAEVERLMGLGATRLDEHDEFGMRWTVLTDVEGNEFCVA